MTPLTREQLEKMRPHNDPVMRRILDTALHYLSERDALKAECLALVERAVRAGWHAGLAGYGGAVSRHEYLDVRVRLITDRVLAEHDKEGK